MKETMLSGGVGLPDPRARSHQQLLTDNFKDAFQSVDPISDLICLGDLVKSFFIFVFRLPQKPTSVNAFIPVVENSDLFRGT